ncbi:L-histidine N(alpha)-methyltransferase [Pontibacter qinzhouensis]|uniref:L-histidine N(alpha)-methyltransferase n=1 Tax=Pontibacter qinzhouensis TaxID=2603253 RepID=UPI002103AC7E|nr:L-histidine N(alpha)-methyltransferase [Pontibacter qinzhouensis]
MVSLRDLTVVIGGGRVVFGHDETIFVEISQKYTLEEVDSLARASGFAPVYNCSDSKSWFADVIWKVV